jgi:flagellar motor switch/type III secretory pathway protein FliN
LSGEWLPLTHSLGVDVKVVEVKTVLSYPRNPTFCAVAAAEGEKLAILCDDPSFDSIIEAVAPGSLQQTAKVVGEYLACRFFATLATAWSGSEASKVVFLGDLDLDEVKVCGSIKVAIEVNGASSVLWIGLGKELTEKLDGLWRRQVRAASRQLGNDSKELSVEMAQLAVPPAVLVDYMRSGSVIDLEVSASDQVTLKLNSKAWLPARLISSDGNFGVEVVSGPVVSSAPIEGTTKVSVELVKETVDAGLISELSQVGAALRFDKGLSGDVVLSINGENVATGELALYEGRFAVTLD